MSAPRFLPLFILLTFCLVSCKERPSSLKKADSRVPILDCRVWGSEEEEAMHCFCQLRGRRVSDPGLLLPEGHHISIDGKELLPDSSRFNGVFYEVSFPKEGSSKHVIEYSGNTSFSIPFELYAFSSAAGLPEVLYRKDQELAFSGLPEGHTSMRLSITDTAFATNDFYQYVTVNDGKLLIRKEMLDRLTNGPLVLELVLESRKEGHSDSLRGRVRASYSLRREFELRN